MRYTFLKSIFLLSSSALMAGFFLSNAKLKTAHLPPFLKSNSEWVDQQLAKLSLEEKIAQFFMVATYPNKGINHQRYIDSLIEFQKIGGLIYFQGTKQNTKASIDRFQKKSKTPLLIGMDAEWGSAMRLFPEERFPYQLTLGAANDLGTTKKIASAIAYELEDLGVHLNFSPVVDVNVNQNNPVIGFRSFGEDPLLVGNHGMAFVEGLEQNGILSCLKHFPGHGDTDKDSHHELPTVYHDTLALRLIDGTPFTMGRLAGASAVMMAHLNVPALDSTGTPSSLSPVIIKEYLQNKMKFKGLIISDALNMKAVANKYGKVDVVVKAFKAGNDILLFPESVKEAIRAIQTEVENGSISLQEVNERCKKILMAKYHAIIKKQEILKTKKKLTAHEIEFTKYQVYEKALTLLKNENNSIPLKRLDKNIAVINIGVKANNYINRVNDYAKTSHYHYYTGIEAQEQFKKDTTNWDIILLNIHASSMIARKGFNYPAGWNDFLNTLPSNSNTILTLFGNPYVINDDLNLTHADAILLGYENHGMAQDRAVQLIFGGIGASGKLPVSLGSKYEKGFGLTTAEGYRLKFTMPEELNISRTKLLELDSIAEDGITKGAYPGCQIVAAKDSKVFYRKSFGTHTYREKRPVQNSDIYDLASITKIGASTLSLMKLQSENKFSLDKRLKDYIPEVTGNGAYGNILLRDMLAHQAQLTPWIPFYVRTIDSAGWKNEYLSKTRNDSMNVKVADNMFITNSYKDYMYNRILSYPFLRKKRYKYSDVGYYFTQKVIEKETQQSLDNYTLNTFYKPMGLESMRYLPLTFFDKDRIVPTENDTLFRKQLVHGYVHDPGAAMMGGVGGHAGLFSNATDLAALMQMFLNKGNYGGIQYLDPEVVDEYTDCQFCPTNRRGAGFDKPVRDLDGGPTCNLVSLKSFGHSGFTGTLSWADPEYGINYVFLSNRVNPSAENWKLVRMGIRTEIQRVIYEAVRGL
ncbi:MAG: glycoside hydrolase family 3 N-terminal domain-containing protein [Lishizhenia sp.]